MTNRIRIRNTFFRMMLILCGIMACSVVSGQKINDSSIKNAANTAKGIKSEANKLPGVKDSIHWKQGGNLNLQFSQISLTHWTAGGERTLQFTARSSLYLTHRKDKITFENYGNFEFGQIKKGDGDFIKSSDKIEISSKVGYSISKRWNYSSGLIVKTQFAPGFKYTAKDTTRISQFAAPVTIFLSLGLDCKPFKNNSGSIVLSPAMGKATIVASDDYNIQSTAGLTKKVNYIDENGQTKTKTIGQRERYEFGGGMVISLNGYLWKPNPEKAKNPDKAKRNSVSYKTSLELFSNYAEKAGNVDVDWQYEMSMKLGTYTSATFTYQLKYDDDQKSKNHGPQLQLKENFSLGFAYTF